MKILVAVPTFETITPETFKSIYNLDSAGHDLSFDYVKGYDCAKARNAIVGKAFEGDYDYILMVDSDIIVPSDAIPKFLEYPVPICFGLYPHKNTDKNEAEIFKLECENYTERYTYDELDNPRLVVKGAGFGCAFISTGVFKKLEYPFFKYVSYDNGCFLSEDLYFCSTARRKGFSIWADTRIRCGHLFKRFRYE